MAGFPEIGENQEWFYLDSTGQEFGPFPSETMRDWFTQGHFPIGEELLVRLPAWTKHVPLRMIYADMSDAFRATTRTNQRMRPPEEVPTVAAGAPQQQFAGYCMMPPPGPYPYPVSGLMAPPEAIGGMAGFGFPAAAPVAGMPRGPGGCDPAPPRQGAYGVQPVMSQGGVGGGGRFEGKIKSFNAKQGFGFIECPEAYRIYGRDVFLHKAQIGDLKIGTQVTYSVEMNKQGMPQARELATLDGQVPGPFPAQSGKGGGGPLSGGGRGDGGGRGKGGGKKGGRKGGQGMNNFRPDGGFRSGGDFRPDGGFRQGDFRQGPGHGFGQGNGAGPSGPGGPPPQFGPN